MKTMKISALLVVIGSMFMSGCRYAETNNAVSTNNETVIYSQRQSSLVSGFNDEEYVWEDFIFTTNRVNGVK